MLSITEPGTKCSKRDEADWLALRPHSPTHERLGKLLLQRQYLHVVTVYCLQHVLIEPFIPARTAERCDVRGFVVEDNPYFAVLGGCVPSKNDRVAA